MKILAFIEDEEVIKKILKHLGLWDQKARPHRRGPTRRRPRPIRITRILKYLFLTIICIATRIIPRKAGLRLMNRVDPRS